MRSYFTQVLALVLAITSLPEHSFAQSANWALQQQRNQQMMMQQQRQQQRMMQQQRQMQRQQAARQRQMQEQRRRQQAAMQQRQRQMQLRQRQMQVQRQKMAEQRRLQQQRRRQDMQRQQAQRQQVARQQVQRSARVARDQAIQRERQRRLQQLKQRTRVQKQQQASKKAVQQANSLALMMRQTTRAASTSAAMQNRRVVTSQRLNKLRQSQAGSQPKGGAQKPKSVLTSKQIAAQKLEQFRKRQLRQDKTKKTKAGDPKKGQLLLAGPAKNRRMSPGVASHSGALPRVKAGQTWLKGGGAAGKVPLQVAQRLQGREFRNFNHFRSEFWKQVSKDPVLRRQFSPSNQKLMAKGQAPFVPKGQGVGKRQRYELDHVQEIKKGGNVYDMNNLFIRSPLNHIRGK